MRNIPLLSVLAMLALPCPAPAAPLRPNIVLIMADDMGYSDIGCYGGEIETPTLDRLAAGGLRFTQFYNTARCCPTRAALLTGVNQHQAGIGHMTGDYGRPAYQGYLNRRCVTVGEALRRGGYRTLMTGKWHVGGKPGQWPSDRGFDRVYGIPEGAGHFFRIPANRTLVLDSTPIELDPNEPWYSTDAWTDYAIQFVEEANRMDKPFFLYIAHNAPHWPLHALPEDIAKYKGKYAVGWDELRRQRHARQIDAGIVDGRWPLTPRDPKAPAWDSLDEGRRKFLAHKMAVYAAQVDRMDQSIGRLMQRLDELCIAENTLVMFLADNGACAEGVNRDPPGTLPGGPETFQSYGLPWANASNTPFRLYKHWVHEGGIATPLVVSWPVGVKNPGTLVHSPGHVVDIMATCVDTAGVEYPERYNGQAIQPPEGESLLPIFRGDTRQRGPIFWEHEGNRAVRDGRWKLVSRHPGPWELYDLEADRTELHNLAAKQPEKVKELTAKYEAWAERCSVSPWPVVRRNTHHSGS
ncbi:MAG: arylsulfatase [Planctomycetes bacterium]|nr:arylsulfatase [Planctomycetota bacterium]